MKGEKITVLGTPTSVIGQGDGTTSYPASGVVKVPSGVGAGAVYLGGSAVTVAAGFELLPGESIDLDLVNDILYAVATVTTTVSVLRRGD